MLGLDLFNDDKSNPSTFCLHLISFLEIDMKIKRQLMAICLDSKWQKVLGNHGMRVEPPLQLTGPGEIRLFNNFQTHIKDIPRISISSISSEIALR